MSKLLLPKSVLEAREAQAARDKEPDTKFTLERIRGLRQHAEAYGPKVVLECLDEIERLQANLSLLTMPESIDITAIHPIGDKVLVQMFDAQFHRNGIDLPENSNLGKPELAKVRATGTGKWSADGSRRLPSELEVGDIVTLSKYMGRKIQIMPGRYLHFVLESEILGKCKVK